MTDTKFVALAPRGADCGIDYPVECPDCDDGWIHTSHASRCSTCKGTGSIQASVINRRRILDAAWQEFYYKLDDEIAEFKSRRRDEFREKLKNAGY